MLVILVGLGGACGAVLRYLVGLIPVNSDFPLVTLGINIVGSFLIGLFSGLFLGEKASDKAKAFLQTGLCGGFTTFSAFSLQTTTLFEKGRYILAFLYIFASVAGCVLGCVLGRKLIMSNE